MNCSINSFLKAIIGYIDENPRTSWIQRINCFKNKYPLPSYYDPMHPTNIISFVVLPLLQQLGIGRCVQFFLAKHVYHVAFGGKAEYRVF